ncbi:DgaE family pyridoxal phosphate-dependent ammonia lyase [Microvirga sp. W0021]|uniref:DgaE family pyridoxal phosphate-dependent ammonia lyase n=1 Tax=Hohaiivirga grylli TaxID=3133970 RepID=A0ABV0BHP6_9HYPH
MASIYERYNLKPVINASGRMTILGVSTPPQDVVDAVTLAMGSYFEMKDLVNKTGDYIAKLLGAEAATVVSSASAGIALSVAAVIVKNDPWMLVNLHATPVEGPREIVLPKGHNVNYGAPVGTMIALGGGKAVEAGWGNECSAEQLSAAVGSNTAAILYIKSHHALQKSVLSVKEAVEVARKHKLPLIVDAAAEEDLRCYYDMGADLVIYSGAKAIEGPTSGLVVGKKDFIEWVKLQGQGIGRAMKVGKEGILGLTVAIESYLKRAKETGAEMEAKLTPFIEDVSKIDGVSARVVWDSAGRDIARGEVSFDEKKIGRTTKELIKDLKSGDVAIYFREYRANEGKVEVDVRSVSDEELKTISQNIRRVVNGDK